MQVPDAPLEPTYTKRQIVADTLYEMDQGACRTNPCYYCTAHQDSGCIETCEAYQRHLEELDQIYFLKTKGENKNADH